MQKLKASNRANLSWAGMLVTIGIVYGDIGTSPLYTMKAIVEGNGGLSGLNYQFLLGSVSLIFLDVDINDHYQICMYSS